MKNNSKNQFERSNDRDHQNHQQPLINNPQQPLYYLHLRNNPPSGELHVEQPMVALANAVSTGHLKPSTKPFEKIILKINLKGQTIENDGINNNPVSTSV